LIIQRPSYHVLIVDDQRDVRRVLRAGLETSDLNIEVTDVPSGEEAILVSSRQPVDLLVVDVDLPGITGLELKRQAEIRNPDLRFIFITGMTDPDVLDEIDRAEPDAFFRKPVSINDFLDIVQQLLEIPFDPSDDFSSGDISEEQPPEQNLSERLSNLRQETSADCVLLLDDYGQYLAQAGVLPQELDESAFISDLMAASSAAARVSSLLGKQNPEGLLEFCGQKHDFLLTYLDGSMALLLVGNKYPLGDAHWLKYRQALSSAVEDFNIIFKEMGVILEPVETGVDNLFLEQEEDTQEQSDDELAALPDLDEVFSSDLRAKVEAENADEFWNSAMEESAEETTRPDVISYEQARKLGLIPEEE
jgi:CheY-like chemotaxis protein